MYITVLWVLTWSWTVLSVPRVLTTHPIWLIKLNSVSARNFHRHKLAFRMPITRSNPDASILSRHSHSLLQPLQIKLHSTFFTILFLFFTCSSIWFLRSDHVLSVEEALVRFVCISSQTSTDYLLVVFCRIIQGMSVTKTCKHFISVKFKSSIVTDHMFW